MVSSETNFQNRDAASNNTGCVLHRRAITFFILKYYREATRGSLPLPLYD